MKSRKNTHSAGLLLAFLLLAATGAYSMLSPERRVPQLAQVNLANDQADTSSKEGRVCAQVAQFYNQKVGFYFNALRTLNTIADEQKLDRAMKQLIVKNVRAWKQERLNPITRALDWVSGFKKPFSRYVRFISNDIKQLKNARKKLHRYGNHQALATAINDLIVQLTELREYVYSHDMYLMEKAGGSSAPFKMAFSLLSPITKLFF